MIAESTVTLKMTAISNISDVLGDYMLKGWVRAYANIEVALCSSLSARSSQTSLVPLRDVQSLLCDLQRVENPFLRFAQVAVGNQTCTVIQIIYLFIIETQPQNIEPASASLSNSSSESYVSRTSTPPTEISEAQSSPTFAPPPETAETRRRREQSDRASSEIGKKLLKGWAMLGEECPNETCYGIPLVRPPKSGTEKDPRKVPTEWFYISCSILTFRIAMRHLW